MFNKTRKLLYRSLDTPLKERQQIELDRALHHDGELRREHDKLKALRREAADAAYRPFRPEFHEQVMSRILLLDKTTLLSPDQFYESLISGFRKLAWAGGLAVVAMITLHLIGADALSLENGWALSDFSLQELIDLSVF